MRRRQLRSLVAATVAGNLRLASRLNAAFWESALPNSPGPSRTPVKVSEETLPTIRVDCERGELLTIPFLVENRYGHSVEASFSAEPLVTTSGFPVPSDAMSFDPPMTTLPPGGEQVVDATLAVTDRFAVGTAYATTVRVHGLEGSALRVEINVMCGRPTSAG